MNRRFVNPALVQRLILAFTTGLFLSCAARVSAVSAAEVGGSVATPVVSSGGPGR